MSTFDEFYQMAQEMLSDPETRSEAIILPKTSTTSNPDKPWESESDTAAITEPVFCFYYKAKNAMVNGTVVGIGQRTALVQCKTPEATLNDSQWQDAAGKVWVIKAVEPVLLCDKPVYFKVLLGA